MTKLKVGAAALLVAGTVASGMDGIAQVQDGPPRASGVGPPKAGSSPRGDAEVRGGTVVVAYDVGDLLVPPAHPPAGERGPVDMTPLIDLITSTVAPATWKSNEGDIGTLGAVPENRSLVVRHNPEVQGRVKGLLRMLRRLQEAQVANLKRGRDQR